MVYDSYEFGKYLMELRRKDNISMSVICEGICDVSVMSVSKTVRGKSASSFRTGCLADLAWHRRILRIWYSQMSMSAGKSDRE